MSNAKKNFVPPITLAWVGDLQLTDAGPPNHRVAEWIVDELNTVVPPDLLQFARDNVQDARSEQFELFNNLPWASDRPPCGAGWTMTCILIQMPPRLSQASVKLTDHPSLAGVASSG